MFGFGRTEHGRTEHVRFGFEVKCSAELSRTITRKRFVGLASNGPLLGQLARQILSSSDKAFKSLRPVTWSECTAVTSDLSLRSFTLTL